MANFYSALDVTLGEEGGYKNDPKDAGGETKWGISKRQYPQVDIKNLTRNQASAIYFRDFWKPNRYGEIDDQAIATKCFDMAVNMGPRHANRILQESVDATADGVIESATLTIVNAADPTTVLAQMRLMQAQRYRQIVERDSSQQRFLKGWLDRAAAV